MQMNRMPRPGASLLALLVGALPFAALADAASWFEPPYKGIAPLKRTGDLLFGNANSLRFDIHPQSLTAATDPGEALVDPLVKDDVLYVYSGYDAEPTLAPVDPARAPGDRELSGRRLSNVAVSWERRFDALNRLSVSAGYADNVPGRALAPTEFGDTHAGAAWTRELPGKWRPSLTGSVFAGDEFARDEAYRQLGRRYLGFAVEGQVTLLQSHKPYLSYQMRRSYYEGTAIDEIAANSLRTDDRSLVSAGWRWQASRSLSLQAEASYGLNPTGQDLYNPERARVLFGTRFDFR
jgi:hypothetical protein